jgi:hypothetical protein
VRSGLTIGLESPQSPPAPTRPEVGRGYVRVLIVLQPAGQLKEGAEKCGAIVVDQLHQSGLLHQAAEFDQVPGARPPILDPLPGIVTSAGEIEPICSGAQ